MAVFSARLRTRLPLAIAALVLPLGVYSADTSHDQDRGGCNVGFHGPPPGPPTGMGMDHGPGMGHGPGGMGPPDMGPGDDRPPPFLRDVQLSEDQQDKVFAIMHAAAPALRDGFKAVHKSHDALRELSRSDRFSVEAATSLAQKQGKAETQLSLLRVRLEHDVYSVLTPEQRTQVLDREHDMEAHHGGAPL